MGCWCLVVTPGAWGESGPCRQEVGALCPIGQVAAWHCNAFSIFVIYQIQNLWSEFYPSLVLEPVSRVALWAASWLLHVLGPQL